MERTELEIRYSSPAVGYVTETVSASTTQGAINLIKLRVPDARINSIRVLQSPTEQHDSGSASRRW